MITRPFRRRYPTDPTSCSRCIPSHAAEAVRESLQGTPSYATVPHYNTRVDQILPVGWMNTGESTVCFINRTSTTSGRQFFPMEMHSTFPLKRTSERRIEILGLATHWLRSTYYCSRICRKEEHMWVTNPIGKAIFVHAAAMPLRHLHPHPQLHISFPTVNTAAPACRINSSLESSRSDIVDLWCVEDWYRPAIPAPPDSGVLIFAVYVPHGPLAPHYPPVHAVSGTVTSCLSTEEALRLALTA